MAGRTVRLAADTVTREDMDALADWLRAGPRVTMGPLTAEFERRFAAAIGSPHAVMVNSGSSANLIMAQALLESGRLRNRKVVVPAVSWATTLAPFMQLGFECLLCDAGADDLGLDLGHLERLLLEHRPGLLILVHVLGRPNRMAEITELCERHGCLVIEDACEALGSEYRGRKAGTLSLAGSFSFYFGHHLSTVEGGAVAVSDPGLRALLLSVRSHGWARDVPEPFRSDWRREHGTDAIRELYTFYHAGFNVRPTELNAFLGLRQLERLPAVTAARERNFRLYREALPDFWCQSGEGGPVSSFAYGTFVANRAETARHLADRGVECRPLVCGSMGRQPFWVRRHGITALPVADKVHEQGLYLPNHADLSPDDVAYVAEAFREVARPA